MMMIVVKVQVCIDHDLPSPYQMHKMQCEFHLRWQYILNSSFILKFFVVVNSKSLIRFFLCNSSFFIVHRETEYKMFVARNTTTKFYGLKRSENLLTD